jgi:DNA polymerase-1
MWGGLSSIKSKRVNKMIQASTEDARVLMTEGLIALSKASIQGIRVDVPYCKKQEKILTLKLKKLLNEFKESRVGKIWTRAFRTPNYNSDQQLREVLFKRLKIKSIKRTEPSKTYPKGQAVVDNDTLEIVAKDIAEMKVYLLYKKYYKVLNTYISGTLKEQVEGFLHPFFHLHTVKTFRSSSTNINFQNQPNRDPIQKKIIRSAFIPTKGNRLKTYDFSGIEVGISCCNHKDPKMVKYVKDKKTDMHRDLAIDCYMLDEYKKEGAEETLRKGAKNGFVFPQFYGDYYGNNAPVLCNWGKLPVNTSFGPKDGVTLRTGITLGQHFINKGIHDYNDYLDHLQKVERHFWQKRFKVYNQWKRDNVQAYYDKGYLKTLTGFTCSGMMGKNEINNYPIQGPAFHCTLKTCIEVTKRIEYQELKSRLIGQIHDELVFDAHPDEDEILDDMMRSIACIWLRKEWPWIIVPLEIEASTYEIDASWATKAQKKVISA